MRGGGRFRSVARKVIASLAPYLAMRCASEGLQSRNSRASAFAIPVKGRGRSQGCCHPSLPYFPRPYSKTSNPD